MKEHLENELIYMFIMALSSAKKPGINPSNPRVYLKERNKT